jgi:putative oxidoreductase
MLATRGSLSATVARVVLGGVLLPHGAQHLFGAFGGYGYAGTRGWMVSTLGVPGPVAGLAIVMEVVAPLLLVLGAGGRFVGAWLAAFMAVAASTHFGQGFFMNWFQKQSGEGFEYHILAIALAVVVVVEGSGAFSLDRLVAAAAKQTATRDDRA